MTIPFIVNHLWQSSCFALLAGLLAFVLRKNSPKIRYWVWLSASLKFLMPFALLVSLGNVAPRPVRHPVSVPVPRFPNTLVQIAAPLAPIPDAPVPEHIPLRWIPGAIGALWALGFLAIMLARCRSWLRVRAVLRAATPLELQIPVRALITSGAEGPGIIGFLRPVLVLPAQLLEHLNPRQLGAILTHEMCHVRRRDNFFAAVHMAVEAIFWFHPLVWWIGSRMLEERELACDEAVLRMGCEPTEYVEGILKVCRFYRESPLPCVSGVTGADIKKRLRAVLAGGIAHELSGGKKLALATIGLAALAVPFGIGVWDPPALHAQSTAQRSLAGTWQGTLRVGERDLRIVMKISNDTGGWKALMYRVDQGPASTPSRSITVQGSSIEISFPGIGATYEGKLGADGNSLSGRWMRLQTVPFNLTRATSDTAWVIPEQPTAPNRMAPDANPAFEAATIKLSRPDDHRSPTIQIQTRRLLTWNKSVMNLITYAYSINPSEVVNGPNWLDTKYDIIAQPGGEGQPSEQQWRIMLQKLLAERFKLAYHRVKKEVSIYALTVTKNGPKLLTPSTGDPKGLPNLAMSARGRFRARNATMLDFAGELQSWQDRPVVDQTGIQGRYDFSLNWTPDDFQASHFTGVPVPQDSNEVPDLFTAIQAQLGLRLESTKGSVDVMVIDRVERPSEN
jgi:uncharacterized protein (TIGR03435 family)